jgi:DNA-binding SARP family transcriptional activator
LNQRPYFRGLESTGEPEEDRRVLQEAVTLYRGNLLPSCYDDWSMLERERLQQKYIGVLERLIQRLTRRFWKGWRERQRRRNHNRLGQN